jgi:hypothetical protein
VAGFVLPENILFHVDVFSVLVFKVICSTGPSDSEILEAPEQSGGLAWLSEVVDEAPVLYATE